jgi:hypothetical protein
MFEIFFSTHGFRFEICQEEQAQNWEKAKVLLNHRTSKQKEKPEYSADDYLDQVFSIIEYTLCPL